MNLLKTGSSIWHKIHLFWKISRVKICKSNIWGTLWDLVPFVQFMKREKHSWMSDTYSKAAGFSQQLYWKWFLDGCFSSFLSCTNGTKSCKASHLYFKFLQLMIINPLMENFFSILWFPVEFNFGIFSVLY